MISSKSFVLFCAGEDSGDALGAEFVAETRRMGFEARGTGGRLMGAAGLDLVADFDELPVSGFGDVVPRYFRLRKIYQSLLKALKSEDCVALVAIDYPGFNMKLSVMAKALSKPVLYVAPPQIWAWKENRAKRLKDARLAVLFEFEQQAYGRHGCTALRLQHPFAAALSQLQSEVPSAKNSLTGPSSDSQTIFLLPGSRKAQALRNVNFYLRVASAYHRLHPESTFIVLLPRTSLQEELQKIAATYFAQGLPSYLSFQVSPAAPSERAALFTRATAVLSAPGTATLVSLARLSGPQEI